VTLRIQRRRVAGWRMPPNTIAVSRPGRWGNSHRVAPAFESAGVRFPEITAKTAVKLHRQQMVRALETWPSVREAIDADLGGRNLACWCHLCPAHVDGKPFDVECPDCAPCHADTLGRLANGLTCEAVDG
jgi:hypothetical protein